MRLRLWLMSGLALVVVVLCLAAVAIAGVIAAMPPEALAARALAQAAAALGRPIHAARAEVALWPAPLVSLHEVIAARAPGLARPGLLTARRVDIALSPWPLLAGMVRIVRIAIVQPRLTVDSELGALSSWHLDPIAGGGPLVTVADGSGTFRVRIGEGSLAVALDRLDASWPGRGPVSVEAAGRIGAGTEVSLSGLWRARADGQTFDIAGGSLGGGAMSGTVGLEPGCGRPRIAARLALGALALDGALRRLAGIDWGLDLDAADGDALVPLFSDRRLALAGLRAVDLDLSLTAETASLGDVETQGARVKLSLSDGVLEVTRAEARLGDGQIALGARLDWIERRYRLQVDARDVPARLLGLGNPLDSLPGNLSLALDLEANGRSAHEIAASMTGSLDLRLADAWLAGESSALVTAVFPWTRDRMGLVIEGAEAHAKVVDGMIEAGAGRITTPEVELALAGMVDLATESLYVDLVPSPRDTEAAGMMVPLIIAGPMAQPALLPNPAPIGAEPDGDEP